MNRRRFLKLLSAGVSVPLVLTVPATHAHVRQTEAVPKHAPFNAVRLVGRYDSLRELVYVQIYCDVWGKQIRHLMVAHGVSIDDCLDKMTDGINKALEGHGVIDRVTYRQVLSAFESAERHHDK